VGHGVHSAIKTIPDATPPDATPCHTETTSQSDARLSPNPQSIPNPNQAARRRAGSRAHPTQATLHLLAAHRRRARSQHKMPRHSAPSQAPRPKPNWGITSPARTSHRNVARTEPSATGTTAAVHAPTASSRRPPRALPPLDETACPESRLSAEFLGRTQQKVNRAYPEQNPPFSAPGRNETPGFPREFESDYKNAIVKVKSEEAPISQPDRWFPTRP